MTTDEYWNGHLRGLIEGRKEVIKKAETLVDGLKKIIDQTDETDGCFGILDINHRAAKESLDKWKKDIDSLHIPK